MSFASSLVEPFLQHVFSLKKNYLVYLLGQVSDGRTIDNECAEDVILKMAFM